MRNPTITSAREPRTIADLNSTFRRAGAVTEDEL